MGISFVRELNSNSRPAEAGAVLRFLARRRFSGRRNQILYRGLGAMAILACLICSAVLSVGQEGRPEITSLEKRAAGKKDPGPRAIGLLQMSSSGKVTMEPIAIMIDGKFYDASSYKASPILMALDGGPDGLAAYRLIAAGARALMALGGRLLIEAGAGQAPEISRIFAAQGFRPAAPWQDLGGIDRVVSLEY